MVEKAREIVKWVLVGLNVIIWSMVLLVNVVGVQLYLVSGESMSPTLVDEQTVVAYESEEYNRGDIVFMEAVVEGIGEHGYVKRVIGIAGDVIEIRDGKLFVNGEEEEDRGFGETVGEDLVVKVEEGHVYVLGDNRENSLDSREFGSVSVERIYHKMLGINK